MRECDRELLERRIKFFPVTLGQMRMLTSRGIKPRKILERRRFKVIEAYAGDAQDVLKIARKHKGLRRLREGLEGLEIEGLTEKMSEHEMDAVTCAYVGRLFLEGRTLTYGT